MRKRCGVLKDNRGSTLLMVIICIAFISILCSLLLSLTVSNIQMKAMNYQAQANFYQTEEILEKIKMGLEEETAEALKYAYEEVMKVYIVDTEAKKIENFNKEFLNKLELILSGGSLGTYKAEPVTRYASGTNIIITTEGPLVRTNEAIILKDIKVTYEDAEKFKTTIRTDIVIGIPNVGFKIVPNFPPTFASYCLLADKQLKIPDTIKGVKVKGDVYAGNEGILLEGTSEMNMESASNIVTRGNISVENSTSNSNEDIGLRIMGGPTIWANNIETLKGTLPNSGVAKIDMDGNCYIKDDLMLNAVNSNVTLRGDYYGYSYGSDSSAESSSAVIINGRDSTLDMEYVQKLTIAGRAYIDINTITPKEIQTGESLAIRHNQYAYLVPDEYMWCGTNPVSKMELTNFLNEHSGEPEVDFNDNAEFKVSDYTSNYTKVFSRDHEDLVYYYLTFPSEEIANRYLEDYYKVESNKNNMNGWISAANIKINSPTNSIVSVGNLFSYTGGQAILTPNRVNPTEVDNEPLKLLKSISTNLEKRYVSIINTLSDMSSSVTPVPSLFDSIVNRGEIEADIPLNGQTTVMVGEYVVCIANGSFRIDADLNPTGSELKGIVIATGSVQVSKDFTGLILSGDTILMDNNVTVTASDTIVKSIISANNTEVNQYFHGYSTSETEAGIQGNNGTFDVSKLITYANWTKNED